MTPDGDVTILDCPGGLYAVAACDGVGIIGDMWKRLVAWRENSRYRPAHHQWLEEVLNPTDFVTPEGDPSPDHAWDAVRFDLYLPISE